MQNAHETPEQNGSEHEEGLTQRIQESHKQELEELQQREKSAAERILKAHKKELAELHKEGGYSEEEISDALEKQFRDSQRGEGSESESARAEGRKWEYAPALNSTEPLRAEYIRLFEIVHTTGIPYAPEPDNESPPKLMELEVINSSGYTIKISASANTIYILNGESAERGLRDRPAEEPWNLMLSLDSLIFSFPKANFTLPQNDRRHPDNWNAERIEKFLHAKVLPLVEEKQQEFELGSSELPKGQDKE